MFNDTLALLYQQQDMNGSTQIIEYNGHRILFTAEYYWFMGTHYKTLQRAKVAVDGWVKNQL
jgi:hypothetical protein